MPDESVGRVRRRLTEAVAGVDRFIVDSVGGERLPPSVTGRYSKHGYTLGWGIHVDFSDGHRRELHVLGDSSFPYTAPRVAVANGPDPLCWPHLESEGRLCILPTDATVSVDDPASVVEFILGEACKLIEDCIAGDNVEDFRDEFLSYWQIAADRDAFRFISLTEPAGPSRQIFVWRGQEVRVVADDHTALKKWLSRWGATTRNKEDYVFHEGVLVWLPEPLLPSEYPRSAADVRALTKKSAPDATGVLERLAASGADEIDVLLGAPSKNGACYGALKILTPTATGGPKRQGDPLAKGFRPGRVPKGLLVSRFLSGATKASKANVERADHLWIHGRDHDRRQARLRQIRIAILGCGSLGAPVARLLAQAGVSNLLLVDCGRMDWPNVGRHELGVPSVNGAKAVELARDIERRFPHLGDISARHYRFGPDATELIEDLATCDLIISTMGNWAAESYLNDLQQDRPDYPPIIYGWVEPNAAAAHAVLIPQNGSCFRCGVDDKGRPHLVATHWPDDIGVLQEPACGALFTPYGSVELCWAHAFLAESVLDVLMTDNHSAFHLAWMGRRTNIEAAGGSWSEKWVAAVGDPEEGGTIMALSWPASETCPVCSRQVRAA